MKIVLIFLAYSRFLKIKQPSNAEPETDTKGMAEEVGAPEVAAPTW